MTMRPVAAGERIEVLDALRGAALFGIIAANMRGFSGPLAAYFDHTLMWTAAGSLFYASAVALLWEKIQWRERLRPFVAVGRMALSNYLLQSIVCTTLFYSWGSSDARIPSRPRITSIVT